jgi:hypothetical protein
MPLTLLAWRLRKRMSDLPFPASHQNKNAVLPKAELHFKFEAKRTTAISSPLL